MVSGYAPMAVDLHGCIYRHAQRERGPLSRSQPATLAIPHASGIPHARPAVTIPDFQYQRSLCVDIVDNAALRW